MTVLTPSKDTAPQNAPPKIVLPFQGRPKDPGTWAYDHRVGLCVTVIAYLVAGIVFMTAKIVLNGDAPVQGFYIDVQDEAVLEQILRQQEQQKAEKKIVEQGDDFSQIRNRVSNENASGGVSSQLNAGVRDDRGTKTSELYGDADAVMGRAEANRRAYEEGLRQERAIAEGRNRDKSVPPAGAIASGDTRSQGKVTVSFSLKNPIRYSSHLVIPAYRCRGGGELVVAIVVNRNGRVTSATVTEESSSVDGCMRETAVEAALGSRFNVDGSAPDKHHGTITYVFIPQ